MKRDSASQTPGHWAQLGERGVYAGLYTMLWTYRIFGRRGFQLLLYPVIGYFFLAGKQARKASITYLSRVYADPRGQRSLGLHPGWRESYTHFLSFGEALLDKLAAWVGDIGERDVIYENREIFDDLRGSDRGALLIASHLGNMEVCRALGQLSAGLKLNVLVHTKHASNFNRLLQKVSPDSAVSLIQTTEVDAGTAIMLYDRVARGEFVVIVGDRTAVTDTGRTSWARFLGYPAPFPQGPFVLAALLECPVQLIFCLKRAGHYHVIFEAFSESVALPRKDRQKVLDELIKRYAARLEQYCTSDPYQWFNFFDFWSQAGNISESKRREAVPES